MSAEKNKISFTSQAQVKVYRVWLLMLLILMVSFLILTIIRFMTRTHDTISGFFVGIIFLLRIFNLFKTIKAVEFDLQFLYVFERGYDIVVPLENIKNVEIKSLGGAYKIVLHDKIQSGDVIYFMPSLIYPLDFSKQDKKVNILRSYIRNAKRTPHIIPKNVLHS